MRDLFFLDIDTQVDFMIQSGNLFVIGADKIAPNIRRLMKFALKSHIPVLSTADTHTKNDPEFKRFPNHCVNRTAGHKKIDITIMPGHVVAVVGAGLLTRPSSLFACHPQVIMEKPKLDMFSSPHAANLLGVLPKEAVVFGVATDYCVRLASLGLRRRGYKVTVVSDAIAGVDPAGARTAIAEMRRAGVRFSTTRAIIRGRARPLTTRR